MQPAFHRDRIAAYAAVDDRYADRIQQGWTDGATIDVAQEMMRLTLGIVGKTLFDADVESQASEVGEALTAVMESFWIMMLPFADLLERLPHSGAAAQPRARGQRLDAHHLRDDRRAPPRLRRPWRSALDAAAGAG